MTQITVKRLWKNYGTQVVLENVNLHVGDHEFVTIVGASGCGKTTFLSMLLGIETPSSGEFLIDGHPLTGEPGPDRGIVFQRYSLFPHMTVLQNLLLGLELQGSPLLDALFGARRRRALERARDLLEAIGFRRRRQISGTAFRRYAAAAVDRTVGDLRAEDSAAGRALRRPRSRHHGRHACADPQAVEHEQDDHLHGHSRSSGELSISAPVCWCSTRCASILRRRSARRHRDLQYSAQGTSTTGIALPHRRLTASAHPHRVRGRIAARHSARRFAICFSSPLFAFCALGRFSRDDARVPVNRAPTS